MDEQTKHEEMRNARMGAIYLWQGTKHTSPILQTILAGTLGTASGLAGIGEINLPIPDQGVDVAQFAIEAARDTGAKGKFWRSLLSWAESFLGKVWEKLKTIFGDIFEVGVQVKKIALFTAQQVFAQAAPFIGAGSTLVTGLVKTGTAFVERIGTWMSSRNVVLNYGHPETIVKAIEAGLKRALLDGIYDIARSSISISLNAASFGGAAIVDAIAAVIDASYKILWRFAESKVITDFCARAKEIWKTRGSKNGAIRRAAKFDKWLRPAVEKVPLIAAVTLGSGIAGDKMRFLNMFANQGAIITQSQFEVGVDYLEQVKLAGSRMIVQSEIEFSSDDQLINGLLVLAKNNAETSSNSTTWWAYLGLDKIFRS